MFLSGFAPQSPSAKFYYYTNYLHFTPSFLGSLDLIGISAILIAITIYNRYLRDYDLKYFYTVTLLLASSLTLTQLIQIFRWNLALGLNDKWFAIFDSFIIELVLEFSSLPTLILACRICPKDIEATIFALLISVSNAGGIISIQLGALLTKVLNITADNFDNLWIMVLITGVCYLIPLAILPFIKLSEALDSTIVVPEVKVQSPEYNPIILPPDEDHLETFENDQRLQNDDMDLLPIKEALYSKVAADDKAFVFS